MLWTHVIGWMLVHFMWQGAVLGLLAAVGLLLLERGSPQARYSVGCAMLGAMLVSPPVTCWFLLTQARPMTTAQLQPVSFEGAEALSSSANNASGAERRSAFIRREIERTLPVVVLLWLAGVACLVARLAGGWWRVRRLHASALGSPKSRLQHTADIVGESIGLRRVIHIVDSDLIDTPTAIGWIQPVVLIPLAAFAQLSPIQVEAILAHELSHIQRHDYFVNLLQALAEVFLFYHPALWWLSARIRYERELCCDDTAVRVCGDPVLYAEALKALEETRKPAAEPRRSRLVFAATGATLLSRVRRILRADRDMQRSSSSAVVTIAVVVLLVAIIAARDHLKAASPTSGMVLQTAAEPAFSSFSIKAVVALTPQSPGLTCGLASDGTFKAFGPATWLITCAYGISPNRWRQQLVGAPDWLDDALFDIDARAPLDHVWSSASDGLPMLRRLLADQFKLAVHRQTMHLETFDLVIASSDGTLGPQMRPTPADCAAWIASRGRGATLPKPPTLPGYRDCGFGRVGKGMIRNTAMPMSRLSNQITPLVGKIVRDMTGLRGFFDLDLQWTPDKIARGSPVERDGAFTTALQKQLGLRLEPTTSSVDQLVIDRVERPQD